MTDIPEQPKSEWPDGNERICNGSLIFFGHGPDFRQWTSVAELPRDVRKIMQDSGPNDMLEFKHHADPIVPAYVRNDCIVAIEPRWARMTQD